MRKCIHFMQKMAFRLMPDKGNCRFDTKHNKNEGGLLKFNMQAALFAIRE